MRFRHIATAIVAALVGTATVAVVAQADERPEPSQAVEFVRFRIQHYGDSTVPIYMASQFAGQEASLDMRPAEGDTRIAPCDGTGEPHDRDLSLRMWTFGAVMDDEGDGGHDDMPSEHWDQQIKITYKGDGLQGELANQQWGHANITHHGNGGVFNPTKELWQQGWEMSEGVLIIRALDPRIHTVFFEVDLIGLESGNHFNFKCAVPVT